MLIWLGSYLRN